MAGEFFGHGVLALQSKQILVSYITAVGFSYDTAITLLPIVGVMDILLALIILIKPIRAVLLWMAFLGFWTALLRPIAGEPIWEFIGRFVNIGAPLALLFVYGWPKNIKEWLK